MPKMETLAGEKTHEQNLPPFTLYAFTWQWVDTKKEMLGEKTDPSGS